MNTLSNYLNNKLITETQINESVEKRGLFGGICGMFAGIFGTVTYSSEAQKARKEVLENRKNKMADMRKQLKDAQDKKKAASIKAHANAELRQWELRQKALIDRIKREENEIKELDKKLSKTNERLSPQEMMRFAAQIDKLENGIGEQERTEIDKIKDKMLTCMVDSNGKILSHEDIAKNLKESIEDEGFKKHLEEILEYGGIKKDENGNYEINASIAKSLIQIHSDINISQTEEQLEESLKNANNDLSEFESNEILYNDAKQKKENADKKIKELVDSEQDIRNILGEKTTGFFKKKTDLSKINPDNLPDEIKEKITKDIKTIDNVGEGDINLVGLDDEIDDESKLKVKKDAIKTYLQKQGFSENDSNSILSELTENDLTDITTPEKMVEYLNKKEVKEKINEKIDEVKSQKIENFKTQLTKYQENLADSEEIKKEQKESEEIINQYKDQFDKPKTLIEKERQKKKDNITKLEKDLDVIKNADSLIEGQAKEALKRRKNDQDNDAINKIIPGIKDKIKNKYLDLNPGEFYNSDGEIGTCDKDGNFIKRPNMSDENSKEVKEYKQNRNKAIIGGYKPNENFDIEIKINDDGGAEVWMDGKLEDVSNKENLEQFEEYYLAQESNNAKIDDIKSDRKKLIEDSKKRLDELKNKESLTKEEKQERKNILDFASLIPDDEKEQYSDFISTTEYVSQKIEDEEGVDDDDIDWDNDADHDEGDDEDGDDEYDSDEEDESGNKIKLKNPAKEWRRKKKKNGDGTTKRYYHVGASTPEGKKESISKKEFKEKLQKYRDAKQRARLPQGGSGGTSESFQSYIKNILLEQNLKEYLKNQLK